jgi:hypothetical protein
VEETGEGVGGDEGDGGVVETDPLGRGGVVAVGEDVLDANEDLDRPEGREKDDEATQNVHGEFPVQTRVIVDRKGKSTDTSTLSSVPSYRQNSQVITSRACDVPASFPVVTPRAESNRLVCRKGFETSQRKMPATRGGEARY